jgi:hypothetical protein
VSNKFVFESTVFLDTTAIASQPLEMRVDGHLSKRKNRLICEGFYFLVKLKQAIVISSGFQKTIVLWKLYRERRWIALPAFQTIVDVDHFENNVT